MDACKTVADLLTYVMRYLLHVIVIDASKSMDRNDWPPTRLDAALDAAGAYLTRLIKCHPDAMFGLAMYSEAARMLTTLTPVRSLQDELWSLRTRWDRACREYGMGNTDIGEGLREASLMLIGNHSPAQVVLLTDGEHNTGRDPLEIAPQLRRIANIAVVGIGASPSDVDEDRLKAIASPDSRGVAQYRWIGDPGALKAHFVGLAGAICRS